MSWPILESSEPFSGRPSCSPVSRSSWIPTSSVEAAETTSAHNWRGSRTRTPAAPLMRYLERATDAHRRRDRHPRNRDRPRNASWDRDALSITHWTGDQRHTLAVCRPGTSIRISSGPTRRMPSRGWRSPSLSWSRSVRSVGHVAEPIEHLDGISRREFARGSLVAGLAIALGVAAKAFAAPMSSSGLKGLGPQTHPSIGEGASPSATEGPVAAPATAGRVLTTLERLPVGGAVGFTDPQVGPAALLHLSNDEVVAYGRTCTHAGCLVGYDQSSELLVCPCHGAEFDSLQTCGAHRGTSTGIRSLPSKSSWTKRPET